MTATPASGGWPWSRAFLIAAGGYLLVVGLVGFLVDATFPTSSAAVDDNAGHIFGVLETNGWHNVAAIAIAVPALAVAWKRPKWTRAMAMLVGVSNIVVFVAFELWDPATFWIASNAADQVVHASVGVGGVLAALPRR